MKRIVFEQGAFEDFADWGTRDKKVHKRIVTLITDVLRQPYQGLGKPEPLKHECQDPCDYIPKRSYPLFQAREALRTLRDELRTTKRPLPTTPSPT